MVLVEIVDEYYEEKDRDPKEYAKIFLQRLKGQSINKENFLAEWEYVSELEFGEDEDFNGLEYVDYLSGQSPKGCICSHKIHHLNIIKNIRRGVFLQIGSGCAKRFLPYHRKTCKICSKLHKRKTSDVCCSCEVFTKQTLKFGKYKNTSYYDILQNDKQYVKWLLTKKKDFINPCKYLIRFLNVVEITLERYGLKVEKVEKKENEDFTNLLMEMNGYGNHFN